MVGIFEKELRGTMSKNLNESEEWKKLNNIRFSQLSFYVFRRNYEELKKLVDFFCHSSEGFQLTNVVNRHKLEQFQDELIRAIHNFVASVGSLVDHTRKFYNKNYSESSLFTNYQSKVDEVFVKDELVSFIQDFRNYCLHYSMPNITTGISFVQGKGTWQFIRLDPKDLLGGSFGWKAPSKKYISQFTEQFDLPPILEDYFKKVTAFYQWYYEKLNDIHKDDQEKVSTAQREMRLQMAPRIMAMIRSDLDNPIMPVSFDSLLAGLISPDKLAEWESLWGTNQWLLNAIQFLLDSEVITQDFAEEIKKKKIVDQDKS